MLSIEFLITSLVVVLVPGTGVIYTLAAGLFLGKRASIHAAVGCTLGILPALLASVLGLAVIFHTSALAFQLVKAAGVAYLLYMAWAMWRSSSSLLFDDEPSEARWFAVVLKGFLINIFNPKLSIFFLAFLPQFIPPSVTEPLPALLFLGGLFMLMTFGVFVLYGLLASTFSRYVQRSESFTVALQRLFAGSFAVLAVKLALTDRA